MIVLQIEVEELKKMMSNAISEALRDNYKKETSPPKESFLNIKEAGEILDLTVPTMYSKVSKGELPVMKRGKRLYFSRSELMEYIKSGRKKSNMDLEREAQDYSVKSKV